MNNLDMLIAEKEKLQKQLDFAEQKIKDYKKTGMPKDDTVVYLLKGDGFIAKTEWTGIQWCWEYWNQGNCYLTYDEANAESKRRAIHQEIKAYANECNGETKLDWAKPNQIKFFIDVSIVDKEIHILRAYYLEYPNRVYFINQEDAEKCVELIGKQRILEDYFQVPTGKQS